MRDIDFLSLAVFIFEGRTKGDSDPFLVEASAMLQGENKLSLDVDTCKPVVLNTSNDDIKELMYMINTYQPYHPLSFHVDAKDDENYIKDIDVKSGSRYSFSTSIDGPIAFPKFHGGEIIFNSDVNISSITESMRQSEFSSVMTSFVIIDGVVNSTEKEIDELIDIIKSKISTGSSYDMFGLLISGKSNSDVMYNKVDFVREWEISCNVSSGTFVLYVKNSIR